MTPIPLQDLARRLSQQESELQALRRELEVRQHQVADLTRRKEGLLTQLQQIDGEIAALVTGTRPAAASPDSRRPGRPKVAPATNKAPARVASPQSSAAGEMSLPKLIVEMLRAASGPLPVRQLAEEAQRRGYSSSSGNFRKMMAKRVRELVKRGTVRRIGEEGYALRKPGGRPSSGQPANGQKRLAVPPQTSRASTGKPLHEPFSLPQILTMLLQESNQPLMAKELSQRALAAGYRTTSKQFPNVVKVTLSKMNNVKNLPRMGYQLRNRRG